MDKIYFGENLARLRQLKDLKIKELASLIGFSTSQWNNYELGTSFPKFLDLVHISKYFEISETDLIHKKIESLEKYRSKPTALVKSDIKKEIVDDLQELINFQREKIKMLEDENQRLKKEQSPYARVAESQPELKKTK